MAWFFVCNFIRPDSIMMSANTHKAGAYDLNPELIQWADLMGQDADAGHCSAARGHILPQRHLRAGPGWPVMTAQVVCMESRRHHTRCGVKTPAAKETIKSYAQQRRPPHAAVPPSAVRPTQRPQLNWHAPAVAEQPGGCVRFTSVLEAGRARWRLLP